MDVDMGGQSAAGDGTTGGGRDSRGDRSGASPAAAVRRMGGEGKAAAAGTAGAAEVHRHAGGDVPRLTFRPLLTRREVWLEAADKRGARHWLWAGDCWCRRQHQAGEGLVFAAPVWDESREAEMVAAVAR